jgi:hypothetical protein
MRLPEEDMMLSLDDCIGMSDLTEDEIAVIAEHERVPESGRGARTRLAQDAEGSFHPQVLH